MVKTYESLSQIIERKGYSNLFPYTDPEAWKHFPEHHQLYNKLWIAETQNIPCGPMGIYPEKYPVIFKPMINLFGMSRGIKKINNEEEYDKNIKDGFFWEEYFEGIQRCVDLVMRDGKVYYWTSLISYKGENGSFEYHESEPNYVLPLQIFSWLETVLDDYSGLVNLDLINETIIECHLRFNGDDYLYNDNFVEQLYDFLTKKTDKIKYKIEKKYIIPIFVSKNKASSYNKAYLKKICADYGVLSLHLDDVNSEHQSEYLARLMMYDISDLNKGLELKEIIIKSLLK